MNKQEYDALPDTGVDHPNRDRLIETARRYRDMESRAYAGFSGADRAEAPVHGLVADALACVATGKDLEATLALLDTKWRSYAAEQQARVASAPKTSWGPYQGQSTQHYKWVSADLFAQRSNHIRQLCCLDR